MGNAIIKGLSVLCLLFGLSMPKALADGTVPQNPAGQTELQNQDKRQKFFNDRLDHIAEVAELTAEEKTFLATELSKYDNSRIALYKKAKDLREAMAKPGLTDKEYTALLEQVLGTDLDKTKETIILFKRLEAKLSPEKRAKVYTGLRTFNAKIAQKIRAPRR